MNQQQHKYWPLKEEEVFQCSQYQNSEKVSTGLSMNLTAPSADSDVVESNLTAWNLSGSLSNP